MAEKRLAFTLESLVISNGSRVLCGIENKFNFFNNTMDFYFWKKTEAVNVNSLVFDLHQQISNCYFTSKEI